LIQRSSPHDPVEAILDCLRKAKLDPRANDHLIHGSTMAINTLIERECARHRTDPSGVAKASEDSLSRPCKALFAGMYVRTETAILTCYTAALSK
jgi:hypothetical protein